MKFLAALKNAVSGPQLKNTGYAMAGGGAGRALFRAVDHFVPEATDQPWKRVALSAGVALVGGALVRGFSATAAAGLAGAMGAQAADEVWDQVSGMSGTAGVRGFLDRLRDGGVNGTSVQQLNGTSVQPIAGTGGLARIRAVSAS